MGTRSSRLQESGSSLDKDDLKRESYRRIRHIRPTSLVVDFSSSFDHDSETNQSRSEEGSDSDNGQQASAGGSPADLHMSPSLPSDSTPSDDNDAGDTQDEDRPESPVRVDCLSGEGTGRVHHRSLSERLPGGGLSSGRSARLRNSRPVSDAWIGLYRLRHGTMRCPFCTRLFPGGRVEEHLLSCLTSPPLPYNTDVLSKDAGECSICLEDLLQGDTIARLACLCVYHKK